MPLRKARRRQKRLRGSKIKWIERMTFQLKIREFLLFSAIAHWALFGFYPMQHLLKQDATKTSGQEAAKGLEEAYDSYFRPPKFLAELRNIPRSYLEREYHLKQMLLEDFLYTTKFVGKAPEIFELQEKQEDSASGKTSDSIRLYFIKDETETDIEVPAVDSIGQSETLVLADSEMQGILDGLITKPKNVQFYEIRKYAERYHPDEGDLPKLMQRFYFENIVRLAYDTLTIFEDSLISYTIDYFEEQLNEKELFDYALGYIREHQGSKTSVEFLFILENLFAIHKQALENMFNSYNIAKEERLLFKDDSMLTTIISVYERYTNSLRENGLDTEEKILQEYDNTKIKILEQIIKTTPNGYRLDDALYKMGLVYWLQENNNQAIEYWKMIGDTNITYSTMNRAIAEEDINAIKEFLQEQDKNRYNFLDQRLRKFIWKN